ALREEEAPGATAPARSSCQTGTSHARPAGLPEPKALCRNACHAPESASVEVDAPFSHPDEGRAHTPLPRRELDVIGAHVGEVTMAAHIDADPQVLGQLGDGEVRARPSAVVLEQRLDARG